MIRLALCLLLLATGASATENVIDVQHDSQRGVTCYLLNGVGISCIPDSQLNLPTSSESQKSRASAPTSMWKNEQLPTTPTPALAPGRWIDERYQL
ncbi:hypothetical protein [Pseudomonas kurunegalensis]|uniref:hypothetical protein n=1 Tax=Pseudomonas kurunegalensis TaxID=485880 RepID=UPI0028951869|nr:hypothetical protein [Pseudomonas kurunegalensis]MDT3749601.1 hypothetical protein [Pseudomonas kurunegalensis]